MSEASGRPRIRPVIADPRLIFLNFEESPANNDLPSNRPRESCPHSQTAHLLYSPATSDQLDRYASPEQPASLQELPVETPTELSVSRLREQRSSDASQPERYLRWSHAVSIEEASAPETEQILPFTHENILAKAITGIAERQNQVKIEQLTADLVDWNKKIDDSITTYHVPGSGTLDSGLNALYMSMDVQIKRDAAVAHRDRCKQTFRELIAKSDEERLAVVDTVPLQQLHKGQNGSKAEDLHAPAPADDVSQPNTPVNSTAQATVTAQMTVVLTPPAKTAVIANPVARSSGLVWIDTPAGPSASNFS